MAPKPGIFVSYGLYPSVDTQVTVSQPDQSRSESTIAADPTNSSNLIAASKKFIDPHKYRFTVSTSYSSNGGFTWTESPLPLAPGANGMTDPALAFDALGNAFIVVEPLKWIVQNGKDDLQGMGMYVCKSTDKGKSWSAPVPLHPNDATDDKQWIACDVNPASPFYGSIYVAWGASSPLRFARSTDHGQSWKGRGNDPAGGSLGVNCYAPEITVGSDGTVHIVWHVPGSGTIEYMRSTDGGETFKPQTSVVTGVQSLTGHLPTTNNWPHFEHATFRVLTLATGCSAPGNRFLVAWADMREGLSRIYYRIATNGGAQWTGPPAGQPLLPGYAGANQHHFHPQLISTRSEVVGCAFYEFGPKLGKYLVDTKVAASFDDGDSFTAHATLTDKPWDPAVNAPWSHGDSSVTFIGEYFGFDSNESSFLVLWTDTRTGVQELFFDRVGTERIDMPDELRGIYARILTGVVQDGGGYIIVGGKIIRVPPWAPAINVLHAVAALDSAQQITHASGLAVQRSLFESLGEIARDAMKGLRT